MEKLVVANWKMNLTFNEARVLIETVQQDPSSQTSKLWIAPSFTLLPRLPALIHPTSGIQLGGQNCCWENSGAFTGEISPPMIQDAGGSFVLVGHSERRSIFGETEELIARKVRAALAVDLKVILCVGETLQQRQEHWTEQVLQDQLRFLSAIGLTQEDLHSLLFAYEPVWAIGTGKVASVEEIQHAHRFLHETILDLLPQGKSSRKSTPTILYGGSVTPDNFPAILKIPHVDGGLVGGASLAASKLSQLLEAVSKLEK